ncbi:fucose isomerase [Edaphobacter acidisoli]|uniref:Fucose isomerase n=1 Tax=Edaphobacter acidisoli TaxID=2040573 RepID=A0A916RD72_9BACT|nr:L-fucose/L-arabinose isomerase family protein [Edaphobacter acidisoli]GGA53465.1 fucose isomerase [Edaphobacter acidisoli]
MANFTLGVILGNRDFFPDVLIQEARRDLEKLFSELSITPIWLTPVETRFGSVETWADATRCGELFAQHRSSIDGILVSLPNFGDEKGVADSIRLSELRVPILVQASPDDLDQFGLERRRDAFCGKISVCNNLRQYGFHYSLTRDHTVAISDPRFREDLTQFMSVCRVARGLRRVRVGAIGARPNAFNTTRFSEKLFEASGISVNTMDLSEVFGAAAKINDSDLRVKEHIEQIRAYADSSAAPAESMLRIAKLAIVIDDWMRSLGLAATAIQCWSSLQKNYGVNVCTVMSMMSEQMLPSACEVDIAGVVSMYALQLASTRPSALVDWNNNYGKDPDKCVFFHCGNWARDFLPDIRIGTAPILGTVLGEENTVGALSGRTPAGPVTFGRISTDDLTGRIRAYVGEGMFTDDPLDTFGTKAVVHVERLPKLMQYICRNGFEHHAAMNGSHCAAAVAEALGNYLGWEIYHHASETES